MDGNFFTYCSKCVTTVVANESVLDIMVFFFLYKAFLSTIWTFFALLNDLSNNCSAERTIGKFLNIIIEEVKSHKPFKVFMTQSDSVKVLQEESWKQYLAVRFSICFINRI